MFHKYKLYEQAREQLFTKLEGLLELRVSKNTKTNILPFGEKPHMPEKYHHNKLIFFCVQRFLGHTKRGIRGK